MTPGTQSWWSVTTWRDGVGREEGGPSEVRSHMHAYG